jgi:hypothetical protein
MAIMALDDDLSGQESELEQKTRSGLGRKLFTLAMIPLAYIAADVGMNYVQHKEPVNTVWAGEKCVVAVNLDTYITQIEENFADAGKRTTIDDYYRRSVPRDDIAPGARMGKYKIGIPGSGHGIFKKTWDKYLSKNNSEKARQVEEMFSKYGLNEIYNFIEKNSDNLFYFSFRNNNYLMWFPSSKDYKIVMKVPSQFASEMKSSGLSN